MMNIQVPDAHRINVATVLDVEGSKKKSPSQSNGDIRQD
jgi:hypothetical protein